MPLIEDFVPVESSQEKSDGGFSIEDAVPGEFAAGGLVVPGALRTATSNVIRGAVQSVTAPVSYLGALTGVEFLGDTAKKVDEFTNDLTPVNPDLADSWLATYIPQGLGQVGAMMVPGAAFFKVARGLEVAGNVANAAGKVAEGAQLIAKAQKVEQAGKVAIFTLMGGAEGNDAYQMAIEQGDDQATAAAKSLGYATVAAAIENKWGTGMLIRRMEGLLGKEVAAKELAAHGLTQKLAEKIGEFPAAVAHDLVTGALEEGSQRFAENLIVTGQPSLEGVGTEGGVGGIVQGLVGLPMNVVARSMTPNQKAVVKKAEQLIKTGSPATAQVILESAISAPLTEAEISILEPGEQKTEVATEQTQTATPAPILPTKEVVSGLEKNAAPLTAAVIQEVALTPKPNETKPTVSDTSESIVKTPIEGRVSSPAEASVGLQTPPVSEGEVISPAPIQQTVPATSEVVSKPEVVSVNQAPTPETFGSVKELLDFKQTRLSEERAMFRREIGLSESEASQLQDLLGRELSTKRFERTLTPEKVAKLEWYFEESPYNQKDGPLESWETDKRYSPEDASTTEKDDADSLIVGMVNILENAPEQKVNNDRFLYLAVGAKRLQELGVSQREVAQAIDRFTTRNSNSQTDKAEYFLASTKRLGDFLTSQGIELPLEPRQRIAASAPTDTGAAVAPQLPIVAPTNPFSKDSRVRSDRYGDGTVLRQIGKRIQVQFDDGTKFAVSKGELTPIQSQAEPVKPAPATVVNWKDAAIRTTETDTLAQSEMKDAQRQIKNLQRQEDRINKKEDLTDKDRENLQDIQQEMQSHRQTLQTFEDYQQRPTDRIEQALDRAIKATDYDPNKLMEGVTGAPIWLTKTALNGVLRVIRAAYKGGKVLAEAINEGVAWLKDKNLNNFNEQEAKDFLTKSVQETADKKIVLDEQVKSAMKANSSNNIQPDPASQVRLYRTIYNLAQDASKEGVATAEEFISQNAALNNLKVTMEHAFSQAENGQPLPSTLDELPPTVVHEMKIAGVLYEPAAIPQAANLNPSQSAMNLFENEEWRAKNPRLAEIIRTNAYRSTTAEEQTALAKAFVDFYGDDIQAALLFAKNPPNMSGVEPAIRQIMLALIVTKANATGLPLVENEAMQSYAQLGSPAGATLQARQTAEKILMQNGSPSLWVNRAQMDMATDQKAVIEPISKASGVREDIQQAKTNAAKSVAADIEKLAVKFFPKAMQQMGATMRSIMEQHADSQEATRKALFDLISNHEAFKGISAADRLKLANELQTLWEKARNKELQRIFQQKTQTGSKLEQAIKSNSLPRLVKLINAGVLSDESIYNALAPELDLPTFDEATSKEVHRLAQEMQRAPEGLPKNQKYIDMMNYLAMKRRLSKWDTFKAYWYASILSGTGTQATNGVAAAVNVQLQNLLLAVQNPATASKILLGAMRGYAVSFNEASAVLGRGDFSNRITNEVMNESGTLEIASKTGGPVSKFLSNMKYVSRMMALVDTMNAMSAMEARAYHLAARKTIDKYRDNPVSHQQIQDEIFEMLQVRKEDKEKWRAVAQSEAAQGFISQADVERRTQDLIRRNRPPEIMQEALNYGKVATFNNQPVGFAGGIAAALNEGRRRFPLLTVVFPFVQTPANVLNELLNYTPVGLWRVSKQNPAFRQSISSATGGRINIEAQELSPADYQVLRAKAVFGFMSFAGVALLAAHFDDDKDPAFDVSGGWYGIPYPKQQQLMAQGKRKWSIKIGDTWIDYKQTPVAIMLGAVGNYRDTAKYGSANQKGANVSSLTYHLMNGAFIVQDMSFLSSLNEILKAFSPTNTAPVETRLNNLMTRTAGGLIPNIAKEIDTWFDPTIQQPDGFLEHLQAHVPVARGMLNKPMINVLGEKVSEAKTAGDRFYNQQLTDDPVWRELARLSDMGVFVPVPSATAKVLEKGKRVKMTDEQTYDYRKKTGELYRQKLERDLPRIQQMNAEQASAYFDKEFPVLRERARAMVR